MELSGLDFQRTTVGPAGSKGTIEFLQDYLILLKEYDLSEICDPCPDLPVANPCLIVLYPDLY